MSAGRITVNQNVRGLEWEVVHPIGSDGRGPWQQVSTEYNAVLQNLTVILLVEPGEWLMRPGIGTPFSAVLDDPTQPTTLATARAITRSQIETYETRLDLTRVTADFDLTGDLVTLVLGIYGVIKVTGERLAVSFAINFE